MQNWRLAADSVDYLAADHEASPFQHFWTLAVEEQFYLGWPLLVALGCLLVARRPAPGTPAPRLRRTLGLVLGLVCGASFLWSVVEVGRHDPAAYFATTTRVWELGTGGLLSLVLLRPLARTARALLVGGGLTAICLAAFLLTESSPFPGLAALAPVLGTAAVIAAGPPAREPGGHVQEPGSLPLWSRLAGLPAVRWTGDRSYSLYLWHFPVVVVFLAHEGRPRAVEALGLLAATALLAAVSYRWVEQPPRRSRFLLVDPRRTLLLAAAAMLATTGVVLAADWLGTAGLAHHERLAATVLARPHGATLVSVPGSGLQEVKPDGTRQAVLPEERLLPTFVAGTAIAPPPLQATADRDLLIDEDRCNGNERDTTTPACDFGDPDGRSTVVLVGDSHARMYGAPFARLAEQHGWHLRTYFHNSCPFSPTPRTRETRGDTACTEPNAQVMAQILELRPDVVVTTWLASSTFDSPGEEVSGAAGLARYWNELEEAGIDVVVLRDVPVADDEVIDCITTNYEDPDRCASPAGEALTGSTLLETALAQAPEADLVDLSPLYCTRESCRFVLGGVLTHRNSNHITETWALTLSGHLEEALVQVLERHAG